MALLLAISICAGCAYEPPGPDDLDVVSVTPRGEEQGEVLLRYRLEGVCCVDAPGEVDLLLPLPDDGPDQEVRSLVWEVDPPATYEIQEAAGGRVLLVRTTTGRPRVALRAEVDRPRAFGGPLTPSLAGLETNVPEDWVSEAEALGLRARVTFGLCSLGDCAGLCRWPEVWLEERWAAVDLGRGRLASDDRVRLGSSAPRALAGGRAVPVESAFSLERR